MLEPPVCLSIEEFEARCIAWADRLGLVRSPRQRRVQTGHQTTEFTLFFYIPGLQRSQDLNTVHIKLGWESGLWLAVVFQHTVASVKDHSDWFGFETSLRKIEDLLTSTQA